MKEMDFLGYVTADLVAKGWANMHNYTFVFPMRRAGLFLKQRIKEEMIRQGYNMPVLAPEFTTIDELVDSLSLLRADDEIASVCALYKIYKQHTDSKMSLDVFYGWGKQLLTDFSNVDMAMLNADELFSNAAAAQQLEWGDNFDEQTRRRLEQLINVSEEQSRLGATVRHEFEQLWKALPQIYADFSQQQLKAGVGTRGARMRYVLDHFSELLPKMEGRTYVFVGFNYLLEGEFRFMQHLKTEGRALFYWDYCPQFQTNLAAYKYIEKHVNFDNELKQPALWPAKKPVTAIATASANAQAQYVHDWLLRHSEEGKKTAIVIADETMLEPVVYALPDSVSQKVNITKGYPLRDTRIYSDVTALLTKLSEHPAQGVDFLAVLDRILSLISDNEQQELQRETQLTWQHAMLMESYYQTRLVINRFRKLLEEGVLDDVKELKTLRNLIRRHLETLSLPFHGEPVTDIQVIGVLETRLLDFDNLLILGVEEGVVPQLKKDLSFIPYYLRKYYGMQTQDEEAEIYAYNFFRLLRRPDNVTLMFSEAGSAMGGKTMSRFLMQMLTSEKEFSVHKMVMREKALVSVEEKQLLEPARTSYLQYLRQEVEDPQRFSLSPSAISAYLQCKMRFYLQNVLRLQEAEEQSPMLQNSELGSLIHGALRSAYNTICGGDGCLPKIVTKQMIRDFLDRPENVEKALLESYDELNEDYRKHGKSCRSGEQPYVPEEHKAENIVAKSYVRKVLEIDAELPYFELREMERYHTFPVQVLADGEPLTLQVGGYIDRLDVVEDAGERRLRVLDYKTGHFDIHKMRAESIEALMTPGADKGYLLQTLIYCMACSHNEDTLNPEHLPVMPGLLFMQDKKADPHLQLGGALVKNFAEEQRPEFLQELTSLVEEILTATDFPRCEPSECPSYCPFFLLCSRERPH